MFLTDSGTSISYNDLVADLNKGSSKHLLCSFVADMVEGRKINLLNYKAQDVPVAKKIVSKKDLINRIRNTKSTIAIQTSGTTGKPKGIVHEVSKLLQDTTLKDKSSVWMYAYNPFHMGGIQVLLQTLVNGDSIIYGYKKDRESLLAYIERYKITHISATPTFYRLLLPFEKEYPTVLRVTVGGERVDSNTLKIIKRMFPASKTTNIYALTETGAVLFSNNEYFKLTNKAKIVEGILFVRNKKDEWYNTGDVVKKLDEKTFIFSGRKSDIINIGGNNVSPSEIEDALKQNDDIQDAVVYHKNNALLGNVLMCDISLLNEITEQEIRERLVEKGLEDYQIPRIIKFKQSLNISDNMKALR